MTRIIEDLNNNSNNSDAKILLARFQSAVELHPKTKVLTLIDDNILLKFLRSRNFDLDLAFELLINYIILINERPDIFSWSEHVNQVTNDLLYYHYPRRNTDGTAIILSHPGLWNTKKISVESIISQSVFFIENSLLDENVQKNGFTTIFDARGLGFNHIYNYGVANARLAAHLTEQCMPIKMIKIHIVFESRLTDLAYSLFKPFLDEKTKEIICFHGHDLESLYQHVPRSVLPESLGGTGPDYPPEYYNQILEQNKISILNTWESLRYKDL